MECNQIEKPIKSKRSTNNSKSSELFNLESLRSKRTATTSSSALLLDENLKLTFDFGDADVTGEHKKSRAEQMRLDKKRAALEKRLAKQKEREAKRLQKEQMRKYRQELKAELNKYAQQQQQHVQRSDSATSLSNNFDQYLIYKPKSILFNQSSPKLSQTTSECFNANLTYSCYDYQHNFNNSNNQYSTNYVSTRLEPFRVNPSHLNSFNETASNYINYDYSNAVSVETSLVYTSDPSGAQFNQYFIDNTHEPMIFESINSENSFQTYENLDDVNCSLLTDLDISVDLIKQDLGLF